MDVEEKIHVEQREEEKEKTKNALSEETKEFEERLLAEPNYKDHVAIQRKLQSFRNPSRNLNTRM